MSLQVWLPLNGDLRQIGTSELEFTNLATANTTIDNSGKIGKCYINNSNSAGGLLSNTTIDLGTNQSMFCWVNFTSLEASSNLGGGLVSQHRYSSNRGMGLTIKYVSSTTGYLSVDTGNGSSRTYNSYCATTLMNAGTWYHVGYTYDGANIKLYVNGVCEKTQAYTGMSVPAEYLTVFCWSMSGTSGNGVHGDYKLKGKINDVRIYDHCVSAAEVKEISQGLVLHYKLDSGYNESTTNLCGTSAGGWNNSGTCTRTVNDTAILGKPTTSNTYSVRATSDGSMALTCGTTTANHPSKTIIASVYVWLDGTQDSSSFYLRSTKTDGSVGNLMYNGNANPSTWPRQQWIRINTNAINTASDATTFYICTYVNKNTEVRAVNGWQIEEKDHVTPYTASGTTRTDIVVQDNSGYNYNGTIIGDPYIVTNSARYENAMYFTGRPCAINSVSAFSHLNTFTYSCWFKRNTNEGAFLIMGYQYGNNSSGSLSIVSDKPGFHYYAHANGNGDTQVGITQTCNDNQWHHLAATYDGTKVVSYFDGVKTAEQNVTLLTTTRTFSINYTNTGSSNRDYQGALSDVRVYCTALDANDIRQLYEVGAKVDNKQNLHTFEINELSSNMFRSELIMPWAKPNRTRIGEIVEHNGYMALNIAPEPFYNNISSTTGGALDGMFQAGSYVFDIWVDVDSVISGGVNRGGGMVIRYSDNTSENAFVFTGGNLGYQHKIYITPANKTIQRLEFYYYTSTDVFYRIDSCIYSINEAKIFKSGIVQSAGFLEDTKSRIIKNGLIETNKIIEL